MKTIIRVPTEQFAFVEQQFDEELDANSVIEKYKALKEAYNTSSKPQEGMTPKEMDTWVENMFLAKGNDADIYQKSTDSQKVELHRIKRALSRIKSRNGEDEIE